MGWGFGNQGSKAVDALPAFSTYAQIKTHYNNTMPIRGSANVRPLGLRRSGHAMSMVEGITGPNDTKRGLIYMAAKLHNTECVRWIKPENEGDPQVITVATDDWRSPSGTAFIDAVLPYGLRATRQGNKVRVNGLAVGKPHTMEWHQNKDPSKAQSEESWVLIDTDSYREHIHAINIPVANALKKPHKEFRKWLKGVLSLKEFKFNQEEALNDVRAVMEIGSAANGGAARYWLTPKLVGNTDPQVKATFMELLSTPDSDTDKYTKWMTLAHWIALATGHSPWSREDEDRVVIMSRGVKAFDTVLLALHADMVLVKKPLPLGTVRRDTYAKWVTAPCKSA